MNFGELRNKVLQLCNQYSVAGALVQESYNNQADYLKRIPGLANSAMMDISTSTKKIPATLQLNPLMAEDLGKQLRFTMPDDFYQLRSGDTVVTHDGKIMHTNNYMYHGKHCLIIPKHEACKCTITYYRYPVLLKDEPADDDVLDNTPEVHEAIAYYIASVFASEEDAFRCAFFNNRYDELKNLMSPGITAEAHQTTDVYGF